MKMINEIKTNPVLWKFCVLISNPCHISGFSEGKNIFQNWQQEVEEMLPEEFLGKCI